MRTRFNQITSSRVKARGGIYEIHTDSGAGLKVGIAGDLIGQLTAHGRSLQSRLKPKVKGKKTWRHPSEVVSKGSILAKHLYFDSTIAPDYDLRAERGRQEFLGDCCYVSYRYTDSLQEARELERRKETSGAFRYVGRVKVR